MEKPPYYHKALHYVCAASGASSGKKAKNKSLLLYSENPLYETSSPDDTCGESLLTAITSDNNNSSFDKMNAAPLSGGATNSSSTYGMTMTPEQASKKFDVLRREATKLERHLEDCVAKISAGDDSLWSCDKLFLAWNWYRSLDTNALWSEDEVKKLEWNAK
ncbi:hypothetical protein QTG54_011529 [Skeletonema marinoi]|uniref:Uncharacterized protein n=1 Tax=Skeletonema marinoi TaxID=267567 RepID=A0AAD9D8B2_9STRA|nr:hypothetical protein QTG54_011529 [Skeletonema marinoi]